MEAPDKIYLNSKHPEPYWFTKQQVDSDIEYISKNALLEWVKSKKARLKQGYKYDWKNDILHNGTLILDSLIDKLNAM